jgi:hypothetical protein
MAVKYINRYIRVWIPNLHIFKSKKTDELLEKKITSSIPITHGLVIDTLSKNDKHDTICQFFIMSF